MVTNLAALATLLGGSNAILLQAHLLYSMLSLSGTIPSVTNEVITFCLSVWGIGRGNIVANA